jgi:uncharacterized protein GlcG (DUF336 family)
MLTLAEANQAIAAALARAQNMKMKIAVSVCDERGRLVAFQRMDGGHDLAWNLSQHQTFFPRMSSAVAPAQRAPRPMVLSCAGRRHAHETHSFSHQS